MRHATGIASSDNPRVPVFISFGLEHTCTVSCKTMYSTERLRLTITTFFCFHCVPQCLSVLYTHSALVPTFHRRCYWMLQVFHTCSVILFVMIIFNTFYSTLLYSTVLFTTLHYPLLYCNLPYPSLHYPTLPYFTLPYYTCTLPYHNPTLTPPPPDPP